MFRKKHIATGKVVIHKGNVDEMPFQVETFTKICSVNTIYFWSNPKSTSQKITHLLKPGGALVLGYEGIAQLEHRRLDTNIFRIYSIPEVEALLLNAGFSEDVSTQSISIGSSVFHCTVAIK